MKLLMITRKVDKNDALAGFAYNWVKKLGSNLEKLYVISWQAGDSSDLPANIQVVFLPASKFNKVLTLWRELIRLLPKVDGLFCHMNPEYTILSAPLAKIFNKRVISWYTHKQVNWRRQLMEILADKILTASKASFRKPLNPKKVLIVGHGIDVDLFRPVTLASSVSGFNIITVGRISPTKDYESIIKALQVLNNNQVRLKVIGDVILKVQRQYLTELKAMTVNLNLVEQVDFAGWVANQQMPPYYQSADLFINMSGTGSVDKVVLEAMACECLVLTSNEAFKEILPASLMAEKNNPQILAEKIKWLLDLSIPEKDNLRKQLREIVVNNHNLDKLVLKIIDQFK